MPLEKDDGATPPSTPPMKRKRKRRRRRSPSTSSSSSSSEERAPRKVRKYSSRLTTEDVLKLLADFKGESSKSSSFSNNLNNVVPEFDPSNRAQTIEGWLKKVNECATIYAWDEKQIVHFSLQKLTGLAKRWFETLPSVVYSWSEWQIKLQKAFPSEENYGRLLEEMLSRTSRNDESLREYYYDKLSLLNRCEISGKKAVDCIVHGLSEGSIKSGAQTLDCREPEGLLNFLCSQRSQSLNQNENRNYSRGNQRTINRNRNDANQSNRNNNVNCFNCRLKGHPYYKCPKPLIKCKRCYRIGHDSDDCKLTPLQRSQAHEDTTSERKTLKIDVSNKANDKFFKVIPVNNKTFEAYIDFGSECSLIRQTDANALQLTKNYDGLPVVRGFGNSSIHPLYKSHVTIKIDEVDASIEILVISDEIMPTSIIVGQNFTELPFITVLKNSDRLTFYKSPSCNPFTSETDEAPLKLYIAEPTEVTETSIVTVQAGDSTYTGDVYIEGYCSVVSGREFGLFQGAYHLANGKGNLIITNLASGAVKFDTGTLIARAVPFLERDSCQMNRIVTNAADLEPLKREDVKIGEGLETEIVDRLYSLLQDYRDCFATNLNEIGCVKDVEMHIELLDNRPVVYRPYRLSHLEREKVRETIDELLRNDIIQESSSSYSSPILMVKKKTGEQRLCVDFRALNNKTCKDRFPLPIIDDQISNLSGNTYFTTLDLASGYYQVPMAKDSQHLTGFVTPDGHYEFKRMPFGLANAPAVFQRMINKILGNKRFEYALAYLDDVLIPSKNADEMFQRLEDVLKLFRQFGLTLKLSKCRFFTTKVEYLGYEVSSEGIQPGKAKVAAVEEFPTPRNIHEVRQFLGLTGYYRKFIQGYGEIARPLTYLLKKDSAWQWSHEQDKAFVVLKEKLVSRPVLALYDPKLETELHTDASSLGVGGILMQWQKETRVLKPVAYFSRQTTAEEKHLHSYELEALAVVCSLKKFRVYLLGLHFKVYTDCAALRTTLTKRDLVPRIARWWLQISEFSFEIEYRPGVQMTHVDALSRNATLTAGSDDNPCVNIYNIEQDNWLLTLQLADPDIARVFKILKPEEDEECKDIKKNYHVKNRTVYRKVEDSLRLVVPRNARWQICKANHDEMGHPGYSKTLERIQKEYWFPKLRRFVKKYVDACIECAYNKDNASRQKTGHLFPIEKISVPFHTIHIDHLGPFVKSKTGNTHILTIVDGFTKYVFVRAVKDTKTKSTIKVLQSIFYDFGIPARIISDRGTSFTSTAFKDFCSENGIKHVLNAVACPRANGQAERYNQIVLNSLATQNCNSHERDWDKQLGKIQWGINNTVSSTTQKTPTEALFGVRMRDNLSNKLEINTENDNDSLQTIREEISSNIAKDQEKQKSRHNSKRAPAVTYKVGDLVKISRNNYGNDGKSTKLLSKFIGPFRISEVLGNDRYRVTEVPGFPKRGKAYDSVIAVDRIRPWIHIKALEIHDSDHSSSNISEDSD